MTQVHHLPTWWQEDERMLLVLCQRGDISAYKYFYSLLNKSNTVLLTMNFSETFQMSGDSSERDQHIDFPPVSLLFLELCHCSQGTVRQSFGMWPPSSLCLLVETASQQWLGKRLLRQPLRGVLRELVTEPSSNAKPVASHTFVYNGTEYTSMGPICPPCTVRSLWISWTPCAVPTLWKDCGASWCCSGMVTRKECSYTFLQGKLFPLIFSLDGQIHRSRPSWIWSTNYIFPSQSALEKQDVKMTKLIEMFHSWYLKEWTLMTLKCFASFNIKSMPGHGAAFRRQPVLWGIHTAVSSSCGSSEPRCPGVQCWWVPNECRCHVLWNDECTHRPHLLNSKDSDRAPFVPC